MAVLTQEVASLVHFIDGLGLGIVKNYFGELPESFAVPSLYYPTPETDNRSFTTDGYEKESVIFMKVFDKDSIGSDNIAQNIIEGIMQARRNIPLYDDKGVTTGRVFHLNNVKSRNLETGVTQIELSYKTHRSYFEPEYPSAKNIYFEGLPTNINTEEDEDGTEEQSEAGTESGEGGGNT
jgi:hypothetical protein